MTTYLNYYLYFSYFVVIFLAGGDCDRSKLSGFSLFSYEGHRLWILEIKYKLKEKAKNNFEIEITRKKSNIDLSFEPYTL